MKGYKLIFISQINRDGSGTEKVDPEYRKMLNKEDHRLSRLSISQDTYIAHGFNSFVVRIKKKYNKP